MIRGSFHPLCALILLATRLGAQDASPPAAGSTEDLVIYRIKPSVVDSTNRRFDEPHYVVFDRKVKAGAPLLLFLPGTGGRPQNTSEFANLAARQGYRVIGLEYVDTPAVQQICPREPDPDCSEKVRRKRIYGDDVTPLIDDRANESIEARLTGLLHRLDRDHPGEHWNDYLRDGRPDWSRIAVSGLSQGAGMAAYIAQRTAVARVVLFSSPWDNQGRTHTLSPWVVRGNGATPADRWFGAYHAREQTEHAVRHWHEPEGQAGQHAHEAAHLGGQRRESLPRERRRQWRDTAREGRIAAVSRAVARPAGRHALTRESP